MLGWIRRLMQPPPQPTIMKVRNNRVRSTARMIRALHFYAEPTNYERENVTVFKSPVERDNGKIARRALAVAGADEEDTAQVRRSPSLG